MQTLRFPEGLSMRSDGGAPDVLLLMLTVFALSASAAMCACFQGRAKQKDKKPGERLWPGLGPVASEVASEEATLPSNRLLRVFSYSELSAATNNFDDAAIVGKGGSGVVYKGTLNDKSSVAVKKMKVAQERATQELLNEVQVVGKIQHSNLVSLQGYCIEQNNSLLVYDFMPNGTLHDALFLDTYAHKLTWPQFSQIIRDTAEALAFLHHLPDCKVIHRDMKPANVLLDSNFRGRLADFGLAKSTGLDQSHVTTRVAGTFGYLAPEYAYTYHLTEKSDVYSFGVLMLVTIARKGPMLIMDEKWKGKSIVHAAVQCAQSNQLLDIVSSTFHGQYDPREAERYISIALHCVQASQTDRPKMYNVERMLSGKTAVPPLPISVLEKGHGSDHDLPPNMMIVKGHPALSTVSERSDSLFSRSSGDISVIVEGR